jgi:gas vesicle protein
MSNNPEEIRTDIQRTQSALGRDVDALAEKVDPTKAMERQKDRLRDRVRNVSEKVMGTPDYDPRHDQSSGALHQASEQLSELKDQAGETVQNIPEKVTSGTRGNPLAAGLIAFGAGWLAATLIPSSQMEQDAAQQAKDRAQPLVDEAKSAAKEAGEHLKPQAQEAAQSVKETASRGAEHVKDEGKGHAQDLKEDSQQAARHVKDAASDS